MSYVDLEREELMTLLGTDAETQQNFVNALEIARQDAIDDPRPNISHDDVMAEMDADIAEMTGSAKLPKRKGP